MDENEKVTLAVLPHPEEDEKPEEGFVPYCGSEESKSAKRHPNVKYIVLIVLAVIVCIGLFGRKCNFYHAVLQNLHFDYREGEAIIEETIEGSGNYARALTDEIAGQPIQVQAAMYMFDEKQNLQNIMSEYDYTHNGVEDILDVKTGSENSMFMKHFTYRKSSAGYQKKSGKSWKEDAEAYVPKLNEYFFGTQDHNGMLFTCEQSSLVSVSGKRYTCELWLMEDNSGSQTVYTTIYRYYDGSRLAGVCLLFDFDTMIEVYDIKNYSIG